MVRYALGQMRLRAPPGRGRGGRLWEKLWKLGGRALSSAPPPPPPPSEAAAAGQPSPSPAAAAAQQASSSSAPAAETLEAIRARVFGGHVGNGRRSGRRALGRALRGAHMLDWYFRFPKSTLLMNSEDEAYRLARLEQRKAAGKGEAKAAAGKKKKK
jgi:hypothetical protein